MLRPIVPVSLACFVLTAPSTAVAEEQKTAEEVRFISDGKTKLGVDLSSGGSVFWLSEMPDGANLLNHADRGRFIQQSYYGSPDGSLWVDKPWVWNPVQGGNYLGKPAVMLEEEIGEDSLHIASTPVHWVTGEILDDCRMDQWIGFENGAVNIRYRFEYKGETEHPAKHQELPAVFVDYSLDTLVFERDGKLARIVPGWPNERHRTPENWAAYVGGDDRGVGVSFPGTDEITSYRFKGQPGPRGGGCSYFAPIRTIAIGPGFVMDYKIRLMIGSVEEIRKEFHQVE